MSNRPVCLVRITDGRRWPSPEFPKHLRLRDVFRDGDALTCTWGDGATVMGKNGKPRFVPGGSASVLPGQARRHVPTHNRPPQSQKRRAQPKAGALETGSRAAMRGALLASFPGLKNPAKASLRYDDAGAAPAPAPAPAAVPRLSLAPRSEQTRAGMSPPASPLLSARGTTPHQQATLNAPAEDANTDAMTIWPTAAVFHEGRLIGTVSQSAADLA